MQYLSISSRIYGVAQANESNVFRLTKMEEVSSDTPNAIELKTSEAARFIIPTTNTCFCRGVELEQVGKKKKITFFIEKSVDEKTWSKAEIDYLAFETKVRETLKKYLNNEPNCGSIPFAWLGDDFDRITIMKRVSGLFMADMYGILNESWKDDCWAVFKRIGDDYWNQLHRVVEFYMQDSGMAASISVQSYTEKAIQSALINNRQIYGQLLLGALESREMLKIKHEVLLNKKYIYGISATGHDWDCIYIAVAQELTKHGIKMFRKNEIFYLSELPS